MLICGRQSFSPNRRLIPTKAERSPELNFPSSGSITWRVSQVIHRSLIYEVMGIPEYWTVDYLKENLLIVQEEAESIEQLVQRQ
ncbi:MULTISPECIES: hypothetical protein [unclassified Coleofasciculus]|uniref:hypothetical protein n=1 Tax=unclassified Coleofasciculus TaxID=2692782 RepID=UPI00187E0B3F|nr:MULTISPECIES: hypothetical protein [unclassified Coleofasciculus]MBE9124908.1 hypothetical protein [Coleofasciculus sp. LEGE 07081]MBE9147847.1 hypothetical protein [Coleofasciculus sp. LEGE 07092]